MKPPSVPVNSTSTRTSPSGKKESINLCKMTNSFQDTFQWVQELQSASMLRHNGDIWSEEGEPAAGWGEPGSYSTEMSLGDSTRRLEKVACIGGWACSDSDSPSSFFNRIKYNDSSLSLKSLMSLSVSRSNGLLKSGHSACIEKLSVNQRMSLSMTSTDLERYEPVDSIFCLDDELLNNLDPRDDADRGLMRSRTSFFKDQIMVRCTLQSVCIHADCVADF